MGGDRKSKAGGQSAIWACLSDFWALMKKQNLVKGQTLTNKLMKVVSPIQTSEHVTCQAERRQKKKHS